MLSIGLGQDQQFTLILQTLQQLKDVYGDSVDKIIQGNTANIVFLKSPDDTLLETLSKMSGTRHVAYIDSKTVNVDKNRIVSQTDERISYTMATKEVPLISYNDMANIAECNSMIFRIGGTPIWNRNQMALPMSHCIHKNQINVSGKKFTLLTVPTTSSALEFDLNAMVPDFDAMLEQRLTEFETIDDAKFVYKEKTDLSDAEINRMDADVYATEIMSLVNTLIRQRKAEESEAEAELAKHTLNMVENEDIKEALANEEAKHEDGRKQRYAHGKLSREDIVTAGEGYNDIFYEAFMETRDDWKNNINVICDNNGLRTRDGRVLIDFHSQEMASFGKEMIEAAKNADKKRVFSEDTSVSGVHTVEIKPEFITWLCELESWPKAFDDAVAKRLTA